VAKSRISDLGPTGAPGHRAGTVVVELINRAVSWVPTRPIGMGAAHDEFATARDGNGIGREWSMWVRKVRCVALAHWCQSRWLEGALPLIKLCFPKAKTN